MRSPLLLSLVLVFIQFHKVDPILESTSPVKRFKRQLAVPKWRVIFSPCAKTCGGGFQRSTAVCLDGESRIDDSKCKAQKPDDEILPCGMLPCIVTRWNVTNFSDCSTTCGNGTIQQVAKCVIEAYSPSNRSLYLIEVAERMCSGTRPATEEKRCILSICPVVVTKVDQICVGSQCPTGDSSPRSLAVKESALTTAILIGAASLIALLRIYLFDS